MKLNVILSLVLILLAFYHTSAQVSVAYFPFQSIISVASDTEKLCWADLKVETNTFASNLNMEFSPKVNFKRNTRVNYYVGVGLGFNPVYAISGLSLINGGFIEFGARIKPLEGCRNLQVVFEISPYVNKEFSSGNIRTRLGIAWNYSRNSKS